MKFKTVVLCLKLLTCLIVISEISVLEFAWLQNIKLLNIGVVILHYT